MTEQPIKRKRGRPVGPDGKRVKLASHRVLVSPTTKQFLLGARTIHGFPVGRTLDRLVEFARSKPDFRMPLKWANKALMTLNQTDNQNNEQKETT